MKHEEIPLSTNSNFPFILFDDHGVCNFCNNYQKKYSFSKEEGKKTFKKILDNYKNKENKINSILNIFIIIPCFKKL